MISIKSLSESLLPNLYLKKVTLDTKYQMLVMLKVHLLYPLEQEMTIKKENKY